MDRSARTRAASHAARRAARYAIPVAAATGLMLLPYGVMLMGAAGVGFAATFSAVILGAWLGSAAAVGFIRGR